MAWQELPALAEQGKRRAEGTQLASSQEGDDHRDWGASPGNPGRRGGMEGRADRGTASGRREAARSQDGSPAVNTEGESRHTGVAPPR